MNIYSLNWKVNKFLLHDETDMITSMSYFFIWESNFLLSKNRYSKLKCLKETQDDGARDIEEYQTFSIVCQLQVE